MFWILPQLLLVFWLIYSTHQSYQQVFYLAGAKDFPYDTNFYHEVGQYHPENRNGANSGSSSVINKKETEILFFFGYEQSVEQSGLYFYSDQVWKFSVEIRQWMFLRGRSYESKYSNTQSFTEERVFDVSNKISGRRDSQLWINDDDTITIFGGNCAFGTKSQLSNDLWRYNATNNMFQVIQPFNSSTTDGHYETLHEYHENNIPSPRSEAITLKINEKEFLLLGGDSQSGSGFWILSTELWQWKCIDTHSTDTKSNFNAVLVNQEIFLGLNADQGIIMFTYNLTSDDFNSILYDPNDGRSSNYNREYEEGNFPERRQYTSFFQINENEFLFFGGAPSFFRTAEEVKNDEWRYNIELNQFRFTGKTRSMYTNRKAVLPESDQYSEETLMGGLGRFNIHFRPKFNDYIVCKGWGLLNTDEHMELDTCWKVYLGNICSLKLETDSDVCLSRGNCTGHNKCDCTTGFFGDNCELSKCAGVLSNSSFACSRNGICKDGKCACYESSIYVNPGDCSKNETLKAFVDYIYFFIAIPVVILGLIFLVILILLVSLLCIAKFRKKLKRFDDIEDIDMILREAELEQNGNGAKIKVNKELFEVDYNDIQLLSTLGEGGSSSVVYRVKYKNLICAFKSFKFNAMDTDQSQGIEEFEKEVSIFSSISHPNILQFYGACINQSRIGILLEYATNGDLMVYLSNYNFKCKEKYPLIEKIRILREIASSMCYLHSKQIIHRDLKPENVLIDENEKSKLMDFGLSRLTKNSEKTMTRKIGTSYYIAPEVIIGGKYSNKCDVYSFAVLIFVIITENFFPLGQSFRLQKVAKNPNYRPKIKENEFKGCEFLIEIMKKNWIPDFETRNTFQEIENLLEEGEKKIRKTKARSLHKKRITQKTQDKKRIEELEKENQKLKREIQRLKRERKKD